MAASRQPVLEFPCVFPLKVMGHNADDFEALVVAVVRQHAPQSACTVQTRLSSGGKYLGVTVTLGD